VLIKSGFDVLIDRLDLVDVAAQQKALQERQGAGRES
jgi:soluble cytochrome b562